MTQKDNIFWGENGLKHLGVLFNKDYLLYFYPTQGMTRAQRLNSISRLIIYLALIASFYQGDIYYLIYGGIVLAIIYFWYHKQPNNSSQNTRKLVENITNPCNYKGYRKKRLYPQKFITPSKDNPFMNALPTNNNEDDPNQVTVIKDVSADYDEVQRDINDKFNEGLFKDISDIYGRANSQRQFYTMPNTAIVNDREGFTDWLYQTGPTCKEGNGLSCDQNNSQNIIGNLSSICD